MKTESVLLEIDTTTSHPAQMYDVLLGGCDQPASACEVHHVTHLADGGTTSVDSCALYCFYHHHIAIHQQGWTVALHPDGTTTARSPDGTKVFHSHSPPS
ncbi:MAG TPA: hypothetical protein VGS06_15675 [Streptosporangiaceae bacterium]|nr:hypothetical protein [Streptosporangiaceae bacterium]